MSFAYREAGMAMLVTSLTTSFSFYSLCFSKISPLPEFGKILAIYDDIDNIFKLN